MKKLILNLGKALNKQQLNQIKGGEGITSETSIVTDELIDNLQLTQK